MFPDSQVAVGEVARVLKPGGRFFFEEVTKQALDRWFYRTFLVHPNTNRFTAEEFVAEVKRQGIRIGENKTSWFFGDFVVGVGRRTADNSYFNLDRSYREEQTNDTELMQTF